MSRRLDPVAKHRRDIWLYLILPVVLGTGFILLALVVLFILGATGTWSTAQINAIASVMLTICILLPLVLVAIGINIVMIFMAWGSRKLPTSITPPLRGIRHSIENISETVPKLTTRITQPIIAIHTRWTRWEHFMRGILGIREKPVDTNQDVEANLHE